MTEEHSEFRLASLADFGGQSGRRSRPRLSVLSFFILAAVILVIGAGIFLWQRGRTATEPRTAVLTEANGLVEWRAGANGAWQTVAPGAVLQAGDQVRTDTGATALITYFEGSITRMGVETSLELTDLSARQDNRWTSITFTQLSGHTDQLVLPLPSADSRFEVTTAAAIIRVQGTAYQITVADNGDTQVNVTQGQVVVAAGSDEHTLSTGENLLVPVAVVRAGEDSSPTPPPEATPTTTPSATPSAAGTIAVTPTMIITTMTITTTPTVTPSSTPTATPTTRATLIPPSATVTPVATLGATVTSPPPPQPTRHDDDDDDDDDDNDDD